MTTSKQQARKAPSLRAAPLVGNCGISHTVLSSSNMTWRALYVLARPGLLGPHPHSLSRSRPRPMPRPAASTRDLDEQKAKKAQKHRAQAPSAADGAAGPTNMNRAAAGGGVLVMAAGSGRRVHLLWHACASLCSGFSVLVISLCTSSRARFPPDLRAASLRLEASRNCCFNLGVSDFPSLGAATATGSGTVRLKLESECLSLAAGGFPPFSHRVPQGDARKHRRGVWL